MKKTLKLELGRRLWHNVPHSLLNCEIVMKKTLRLGRRPQHNFSFFWIFPLVRLMISDILKLSLLACLILEIAMKKTLKLGFGRRPQQNFQFFLQISSCLVRIKLHTKNQPPSLLYFGYRYEEDLTIRIWKKTLTTKPNFSQSFF